MNETEGGLFSCRNTCWIVGALLGLVAFLLILKASVIWALIVGIVLGVVVVYALQRLFCTGVGVGTAHHHIAGAAAVTTGAGASAALDHSDDDQSRAAADAAASAMMGDEETASGIAAEGGRATPAAALDAASVKADEPAHTHAEVAAKAPAPKPVAEDGKPELFATPQGEADDLKLIKGVGPKLEEKLNGLGVWHYSQIAGWRKAEIDWVDDQLSFRGRIERDDWIKQAEALAKGEATEFSKRASKSGLYDKK